jgi:hypothetical protein
MIGTTISHYCIAARLGSGGMGVVYRAVDARLNRTVALKVLRSDAVADPDRKRRFVTEARAASALNHPNIVTIHEIDEADGVGFLVMELITGQPLDQLIPAGGLAVECAIDYAIQIATALAAAHAAGIVHFEVTNREFKTFVDRGGYRSREFWKERFVENGRTLSWEDSMAVFRDTTGRPGPSTWELGTYPETAADLPVTGVSWYEAAAYAVFARKDLPTAFHWRVAAGYADFTGNFADILNVSNYSGKGLARVGSYQGLGPSGTYDMAGNAKEWCSNETGDRRFILGGGWDEPSYSLTDMDAQPPFDRHPTNGFRLAKYIEPPTPKATAPITQSLRDFTRTPPVSDAIFDVYRNLYRYDATPLNVNVESAEDTPDWSKETVSFDAAYSKERVRAYLFLPKTSSPPYQTVVFFPGADAMFLRSSRELRMQSFDFSDPRRPGGAVPRLQGHLRARPGPRDRAGRLPRSDDSALERRRPIGRLPGDAKGHRRHAAGLLRRELGRLGGHGVHGDRATIQRERADGGRRGTHAAASGGGPSELCAAHPHADADGQREGRLRLSDRVGAAPPLSGDWRSGETPRALRGRAH